MLDLELMLVPRKLVPAAQSLLRYEEALSAQRLTDDFETEGDPSRTVRPAYSLDGEEGNG